MPSTIYIFHDIDKAYIAALEYVIFKYGENFWFNAALNKVVTDTLIKPHNEICSIPFIIIKKNENQLSYKGYHYIIHQLEKYNNITTNNLIYKYNLIALIIITFIILGFCIYSKRL